MICCLLRLKCLKCCLQFFAANTSKCRFSGHSGLELVSCNSFPGFTLRKYISASSADAAFRFQSVWISWALTLCRVIWHENYCVAHMTQTMCFCLCHGYLALNKVPPDIRSQQILLLILTVLRTTVKTFIFRHACRFLPAISTLILTFCVCISCSSYDHIVIGTL